MFDLKSPCKSCPFRRGRGSTFQLHPERLAEIRRAVAFQCHLTVDYGADEDEGESRAGDRPQQCAGLMALLTREDEPNQIMQVGQRFGSLDPASLDPRGEAYLTWAAVEAAHQGREP